MVWTGTTNADSDIDVGSQGDLHIKFRAAIAVRIQGVFTVGPVAGTKSLQLRLYDYQYGYEAAKSEVVTVSVGSPQTVTLDNVVVVEPNGELIVQGVNYTDNGELAIQSASILISPVN